MADPQNLVAAMLTSHWWLLPTTWCCIFFGEQVTRAESSNPVPSLKSGCCIGDCLLVAASYHLVAVMGTVGACCDPCLSTFEE
jgi:hypothetical protein